MPETLTPGSFEAAARALVDAGRDGASVSIAGAGTKRGWGAVPGRDPDLVISTERLNAVFRHDAADLTAVVGAGMSLAGLREHLAPSGQMLALDPPMSETATLGGVVATADSGPWRHGYGPAREQILGVSVALSDGSVARSGAGVIRNVAGYDLPRLFCGSFGTLGVILAVNLRLVPAPEHTATALGLAPDPETVAAAVARLATAPLELAALDIAWRGGRGGLLAQVTGDHARRRAGRAAAAMGAAGLGGTEVVEQDAELWARQRSGQRSAARALVRVGARCSDLARILTLSDACEATLVGRAALGVSYLELDPSRVSELRSGLPTGAWAELLDRPSGEPGAAAADPWGETDAARLGLMRAVKAQFDPAGVCNPGVFVGGI